MPDLERVVDQIAAAKSWDGRVSLIRQIPEKFGTAQHAEVYSNIAKRVYVPHLAPDFAYVAWREDYELEPFLAAYESAKKLTAGFTRVSVENLSSVIQADSKTLRIFRVLLGLTPQEFAASTVILGQELERSPITPSRIKYMEAAAIKVSEDSASLCAELIHRTMTGAMFETPSGNLYSKLDKPDTTNGWKTVQQFARQGVPFGMFLHQRHYGGAFRQLLDATSTLRGNLLEEAVEDLLKSSGVQFIRTGSHNQAEIETRFSLTVRPAPDFVVFDSTETLRAIIECKGANDGGTARDKASRFRSLRTESIRIGGVPLFAILSGLGWTRTADALGPVVRDTDGRVFTLANLRDMTTAEPFRTLVRARRKTRRPRNRAP